MTASQAEVPRMSFLEATNIGNQLLAMGRITREQLALACAEQEKLRGAGHAIRIGDVLSELGFASRDDLEEAFQRQCRARDTCPSNQGDVDDAMKILKQTAAAFHKSTETRLRAYAAAAPSGLNGHSGGHLNGALNGHDPDDR